MKRRPGYSGPVRRYRNRGLRWRLSCDELGRASLCDSHQTEQRDGCDERSVSAHNRGLDESASIAEFKHGMRLR